METVYHSVKLLNTALIIASISKEYMAENLQKLEYLLDEALSHARHTLLLADIIPEKIKIKEETPYYNQQGKVATRIGFDVEYRTFSELSLDQKDQINRRICREKKTPYSLGSKQHYGSFHKKTFKKEAKIIINANGSTISEVFTNLKNAIWNQIPEFRVENQPLFEMTVKDLKCWKNSNSNYQAECTLYIIREIVNEQKNENNDLELS